MLRPIAEKGYSRYDSVTGNRMPYLEPTDGFPELVVASDSAEPATTTRDISQYLLERQRVHLGLRRQRLSQPDIARRSI